MIASNVLSNARRSLIATLAGLALVSSAGASTSSVIGFYNVSVPAGNSAWVCGLTCADLFQGAAISVTADVDGKALVQFSAPGWTPGTLTLHYAEPLSGICAGLAIDVLSNTADTLKLNTTPAAAGLSNGMVLVLRKHATLGGLLPDGGGFVPFNDTFSVFNGSGQMQTYLYTGGSWIDGLGGDATNVIIRPGQGFVVQVASPLNLLLGKGEVCYVKSTPTKIRANASVPNLLGPLNPLGASTTLSSLGITSALEPFNDSIVILTPGSLAQFGTYLSTGSNLIDGLGSPADGTALSTGASVVVNVDAAKNVQLTPVTVSP